MKAQHSNLCVNFWRNLGRLLPVGVRVDGRILEKSFRPQTFDSVGFQFPHAGTRESKFRRTENHVLIRRFLRSASNIVSPQGILFITFVDSEFYRGQFALDEAASFAKVEKRMELPFTPSLFAGYRHGNTQDFGSAIGKKATFTTAVFCR